MVVLADSENAQSTGMYSQMHRKSHSLDLLEQPRSHTASDFGENETSNISLVPYAASIMLLKPLKPLP